jgi:DNA transformation protein and related proteins
VATSQSTTDFILDQLSSVPKVRVRKMFGEYALYCDDKVVALICDDQLFVKITAAGKALVGDRYAEGIAYPGARPSILVSASDLEDNERLSELIRVTTAALPPPKPKKPPSGGKARGADRRKGTSGR